jgi:hypothetical protein
MRLRNPEGVAQPGDVSPVLVAACLFKRRRAIDSMEGPFAESVCWFAAMWVDERGRQASGFGFIL